MTNKRGEATPMSTIEKLMLESKNEVAEEVMEKYKKQIKEKFRAKAQAEKLVRNIDAEIVDLKMRIEQELA